VIANIPVKKLGSREFLLFDDGLVPVDDVRAIEPGDDGTIAVELRDDVRMVRHFRPAADAPAPPAALRRAAAGPER
jgi:hypothetical protein